MTETEREASSDRRYSVLLTDTAIAARAAITSKADRREVDAVLKILDTVPYIGHVYDPLFEAARPNIDGLLELFAGHYGIYYVINEQRAEVWVLALEDSRSDPQSKFSDLSL